MPGIAGRRAKDAKRIWEGRIDGQFARIGVALGAGAAGAVDPEHVTVAVIGAGEEPSPRFVPERPQAVVLAGPPVGLGDCRELSLLNEIHGTCPRRPSAERDSARDQIAAHWGGTVDMSECDSHSLPSQGIAIAKHSHEAVHTQRELLPIANKLAFARGSRQLQRAWRRLPDRREGARR